MSLIKDPEEISRKAEEYYKLKYKRGANREHAKKLIWGWSGNDYNLVRDLELGKLDPIADEDKISIAENIIDGLKSFNNKLEHDTVLVRGTKGTYDYDTTMGQ